jgi:alkanesulfonate monooxygenase SsuD/methylene tetrahydromethanopterin reductase-like flavin-dependent oxidoreductase (luciferase family)
MVIGLACSFAVPTGHNLAETIAVSARSAESLGLGTFWAAGDREANSERAHDPTLGIFVVARATKKIGIGLSGDLPAVRTAAVRAKQIATIDWYSGGRLSVSVDLDPPPAELIDPYWNPTSEFAELASERYAAMCALWTQQNAAFHGKYLKFDDAYAEPQPVNHRVPYTYLRATETANLSLFAATCAVPDGVISWLVDGDQVAADANNLAEAIPDAQSVRRTWCVPASQFAEAQDQMRSLGLRVDELVAWFDHVPGEREIFELVS